LFESPTIAGLAAQVQAATETDEPHQPPPIARIARDGDMPLSFAQQRLWFLDQLEPDSPFYNMPLTVRLKGPLHLEALQDSLDEIVRRHEALRTIFPLVDSQPVQRILPEAGCPLSLIDLRSVPQSQREAEIARRLAEETRRPFDLAHGPLIRSTILRADEHDHVLLITMHHIVSDGWSLGVLVRELAALYEAFSGGNPAPLADLPVQYADYAVWQRQWLAGERLETQLGYWRTQLHPEGTRHPPVLELPLDRPRPEIQTFHGARHTFSLDRDLSASLKELSQRRGCTLFMTLLTAFQVFLHRYTGQHDILVGSPIANRTRVELEPLIGFFANTLVLRADLSGNPTFVEALERVRQVCLGAYAHQDLPFERIVEELQPERSLRQQALFQVAFALQSALIPQLQINGVTFQHVETNLGAAKFDLALFMDERDDHLCGMLEYNTDLFESSTIERMVRHFETLLRGIAARPDTPIAQLPLMSAPERQQMVSPTGAARKKRQPSIDQLVAKLTRNKE
ncbi:MAG TPA: condensation domain-containing protein, partial [Herpetosiphonaceae bacterium]